MGRPRNFQPRMNGLLIVDKPLGMTSMDVCRVVRRSTGGAKVGHGGTLDPLATGVVVCCLGSATRLVERLMGLKKTYEAAIDLSAFTRTDDREGEREEVAVASPVSRGDLELALHKFEGEIQQVPPIYSAVHVQGRRAYKLARAGEAVKLEPRTVRVYGVTLVDYNWPVASVRIRCGRGTYIRSLARDLGGMLGTGGHLASLRRTAVGPFTVADAMDETRMREPITAADLLDVDQIVWPTDENQI